MYDTDVQRWMVLIDDDGRYGLLPAVLPVPRGWGPAGFAGSEEECMGFVDELWRRDRPASAV